MKKNEIRVIAIFEGYSLPHLGGVEKYVDNLSKKLIDKGYKIIIVSSNYNNDNYKIEKENLIEYKIPVFNIFKNRYPILKKNKEYKKILKELEKMNIDRIIVNTRFYFTSHVGANFGKKNNIPVYLIEHGSNYVTLDNKFIDFFANRYEDFLTWKIKKKIKGFYGVSKAAGEWLKRFNIDYKGIWYNSIDIDQNIPRKVKNSTINFLYAGRIIKQKGVENILISFQNLHNKYKNIKLFIAGNGSELEIYKSKYKNKNLFYLGKLSYDELKKYYAKTDIFLYPPLWPEGLPTSILEAGLMNCAIIGTNQGGIKEVIKENNGIIVGNEQTDLEKAMKKLIEDEKLRKKISNQLKKDIIDKFSWDVTANKIIKDIKK